MNNIVVLVGLPGAGKGEIAKKLIADEIAGFVSEKTIIVSLDNIREMVNGKYEFDESKEDIVWSIGFYSIKKALTMHYDVIIDDTLLSINKAERASLLRTLRSTEVLIKNSFNVIAVQVNTPSNICKLRRVNEDKGLGGLHWIRVIDELSTRYEPIAEDGLEGFDMVAYY